MANKIEAKKTCPICKKTKIIKTGFYKTASPLSSDGSVQICTNCVKNEIVNDDGTINRKKLKTMCQRLDKPLYWDDLESSYAQYRKEHGYLSDDEVARAGKEIIGIYFKNTMLRQNKNKSFADSEIDNFIHVNSNTVKAEKDRIIKKYMNSTISDIGAKDEENEKQLNTQVVKFTKQDKQNMKYAITTFGYDPFQDIGLDDVDKKYAYNILAGYCDTDGILEDGHKMQSVIEITMLYCQVKKISEAMNIELKKGNVDEAKIQKLTNAKSSLLSSIATIAKDNNIASNYNKQSKQGQSSLTSKMKEMEENGYKEIEVNLFDIKTSEAFRQISEISNTNIANQLMLDSNEYTDIIKQQREKVLELTNKCDELEEENRQLKNKLVVLESKKG